MLSPVSVTLKVQVTHCDLELCVMKKSGTRQLIPEKPKLHKDDKKSAQGAFSRVFTSQQTKVNSKKEVSDLLTHFAEEDLKRIAAMIQKWLDKDAREKALNSVNRRRKG